jgi:MFS family permease
MQTDWASENLQVIRTLMERSAVYRRALAPVMGLVGATGIAAGVLGAVLDFETSRLFAAYWGAVALVCLAEALLLIRRQAVKALEPFWSPPTRRIAQAVAPAFVVGLVIGIVFFFLNIPEQEIVLPLVLVWIGVYGLAMHAAGFFMPRGVRIFGWGYVIVGLAAFFYLIIAADNLAVFPIPNPNVVMGVLFGGGHAAYGLYLYFTEKREKVA